MKRTNTVADVLNTGMAEVDVGDGVTLSLPLDGVYPSWQEGRLGSIEAKQAVKCVHLETGKWVWGLAGATHFVIPDHTGALIVRATAQPVPASTPALDW